MKSISMVVVGLVCLVSSVLSIYGLAPREGRPFFRWMKIEAVEVLVALALATLILLGVSFVIAGIA